MLQMMSRTHFLLIIAVIPLLLYLPHAGNGFIDVDDPGFITENPLVTHPTLGNVARAFVSFPLYLYIPLTIVSYQFTALIGGLTPLPFHLVDILLHTFNVVLVAAITLRLTEKRFMAFTAALLFAVHPLFVEAVLWASSRKDVFSASFALLSLFAYVRSLEGNRSRWLPLSLLFFTLGLLAKVAIAPLPLTFLLLDRSHGRYMRTALREKVLFFAAALAIGTLGSFAAAEFVRSQSPLQTFLLGTKSTAFYVEKLLWPSGLSIFHLQPTPVLLSDASTIGALVLFLLLWVLVILLFLRSTPLLGFGLGIFLLLLLPTFVAAEKGGMLFLASEKYMYLPSVGLFLIAGYGLEYVRSRIPRLSVPLAIVVALVAGLFAMKTSLYARAWRSSETLHTHVVGIQPGNPLSLSSLGLIHAEGGDLEGALQYFEKAIAGDEHYAIPYFNAATILRKLGKSTDSAALEERIPSILTAREVQADHTLQKQIVLLGIALKERGKFPEAITALEAAANAGSTDPHVYYHLAEIYSKDGRTEDVIRVLREALKLDPGNANARMVLQELESAQ